MCGYPYIPTPPFQKESEKLTPAESGGMLMDGCSPVVTHAICCMRSADCRHVCFFSNPAPRSKRTLVFKIKLKALSTYLQFIFLI